MAPVKRCCVVWGCPPIQPEFVMLPHYQRVGHTRKYLLAPDVPHSCFSFSARAATNPEACVLREYSAIELKYVLFESRVKQQWPQVSKAQGLIDKQLFAVRILMLSDMAQKYL